MASDDEQTRVVLVTGGNRGIGRAIAEAFVAQGNPVAVTVRDLAVDVPKGVLAVQADMTDGASIDSAFKQIETELGPVEVLVANAGITADTLLLRMSEDQFAQVVETNLTGAFRCAKRATGKMLRKRWGRLIFVSSVVGMSGSPGQVNYAASKAGLIGMARSIARELGSRSITANVITPGFIDTDMTKDLPPDRRDTILENVPLGRFGDPADVAGVALWLASPQAAYVTGAVIPVDGGLGMGH